jgi:Family of unknown function (DUF6941)
MKIVLAVLADAANVSQEGKLNILGNFANINASDFPARHPQMQLVLRMEASAAEVGGEKKMEVILMDADGKSIGRVTADFTVPEATHPGESVRIQTIFALRDTVFPAAGRYGIYVLINGNQEAVVPLTVGGG